MQKLILSVLLTSLLFTISKAQNSKEKIGISKNGKLVIENCATNIPGVFAGGDCVNGGKEVVDAVQAGKDGAKAILDFISRKEV